MMRRAEFRGERTHEIHTVPPNRHAAHGLPMAFTERDLYPQDEHPAALYVYREEATSIPSLSRSC